MVLQTFTVNTDISNIGPVVDTSISFKGKITPDLFVYKESKQSHLRLSDYSFKKREEIFSQISIMNTSSARRKWYVKNQRDYGKRVCSLQTIIKTIIYNKFLLPPATEIQTPISPDSIPYHDKLYLFEISLAWRHEKMLTETVLKLNQLNQGRINS